MEASWTDDFKGTGRAGPNFYRLPFHNDEVVSVVSQANKEKFFAWYEKPAGANVIVCPREPRHGFRKEDDEEEIIHPLRHRFREILRRRSRRKAQESWDRSQRQVWVSGSEHLEVLIQPEDIHGALRAWGDEGSSVKVQYLPNIDAPKEAVACSLYVVDFDALDDPDWYLKPTKFRLVPSGRNVEGLLDAILAHLRPA